MTREQVAPALIAALLREGVDPDTIQAAVADVLDMRLGQSMAPDPLHRAFAHEQAGLLERRVANG